MGERGRGSLRGVGVIGGLSFVFFWSGVLESGWFGFYVRFLVVSFGVLGVWVRSRYCFLR